MRLLKIYVSANSLQIPRALLAARGCVMVEVIEGINPTEEPTTEEPTTEEPTTEEPTTEEPTTEEPTDETTTEEPTTEEPTTEEPTTEEPTTFGLQSAVDEGLRR